MENETDTKVYTEAIAKQESEIEFATRNREIVVADSTALAISESQAKSLEVLSTSVKQIADFISGGALNQLLSGYARSQAVKDILGGLASHDGRNSLDARTMGQNSIEIVELVERVFKKYAERIEEQANAPRDPDIHAPAEEYVPRNKR